MQLASPIKIFYVDGRQNHLCHSSYWIRLLTKKRKRQVSSVVTTIYRYSVQMPKSSRCKVPILDGLEEDIENLLEMAVMEDNNKSVT